VSAFDALVAWYVEALARRDGSWAPVELRDAAVAELLEAVPDLDPDVARSVVRDEVDARLATIIARQTEAARASLTGAPLPAAPTKRAREKIPEARRVAAEIRRDTRRPAALSVVADRIGVDRGTLSSWIEHGWLRLDK
jgi:crotonobetainyl-CoA:carnitine CoA-transferase CaiB-like acyl-CoA transferase